MMYIRWYFETTVTGTSYAVTGLTASTAYTFCRQDAAGNVSASSNVISVTTTAPTVSNCTSEIVLQARTLVV
jgi:chitodextrinase